MIKYEQILFIQFCMRGYFRKVCDVCMDVHTRIYLLIVAVKVLLRIFYRIFLMIDQGL